MRGGEPSLHYQVWSQNGPGGPSYEYKVNCGLVSGELEVGFLWDLTRVVVTDPEGCESELAKDFNRNPYSGEVTRRWVLYGPPGAGYPKDGCYTFAFYRSEEKLHERLLNHTLSVVPAPAEVAWRREGNDLLVTWRPPAGIAPEMWYKVIVFRADGQVLSQVAPWDATSARLGDFPLAPGERAEMSVAAFSPRGYAYTANQSIVW